LPAVQASASLAVRPNPVVHSMHDYLAKPLFHATNLTGLDFERKTVSVPGS
jgi:hypothetical protein